jgi:hypothetical protein
MASQESKETLNLLKELSVMKQLDGEYEAGPKTDSDREAYRNRQHRHQEIVEAIKNLASRKKGQPEEEGVAVDHTREENHA